jgi:hypothetical protein
VPVGRCQKLVSCQRDRLIMGPKLDSGIKLPLLTPQRYATTDRKPTTTYRALSATRTNAVLPKTYTTAQM